MLLPLEVVEVLDHPLLEGINIGVAKVTCNVRVLCSLTDVVGVVGVLNVGGVDGNGAGVEQRTVGMALLRCRAPPARSGNHNLAKVSGLRRRDAGKAA